MIKERTLFECKSCSAVFILTVVETDFDNVQVCPFCKNQSLIALDVEEVEAALKQ